MQAAAVVIDVGTTNTKILLFDTSTAELCSKRSFRTPKIIIRDEVDFDSALLFQNITNEIKNLAMAGCWHIEHILIASVGEMGVIVDAAGAIMGPMLAWNDSRGKEYIDSLSFTDWQRIQEITGLPPHSNYSIAKIKWLEQHCHIAWEEGLTWLNLPDYISFLLTGIRQTVSTMASRTMAFDLRRGEWSEELIMLYGVPRSIFPPLAYGGDVAHVIELSMARRLGLDENTRVSVVGHDHMVGSLAVGLKEGELLNSTGTTEGFLRISSAYPMGECERSAKLAGGRFVFPEKFTLYGSLPAAGLSYEWARKMFRLSQKEADQVYMELLEDYRAGKMQSAQELLFIPHLVGSGSPDKNIHARGMLYGLTANTSIKDFFYAVAQGVCMELRHLYDTFIGKDNAVSSIKVIGPATKNDLWLQLKADALNQTIFVTEVDEAVSYGALVYAYPSLAKRVPMSVRAVHPNAEYAEKLNRLYTAYMELYERKIMMEHSIGGFK